MRDGGPQASQGPGEMGRMGAALSSVEAGHGGPDQSRLGGRVGVGISAQKGRASKENGRKDWGPQDWQAPGGGRRGAGCRHGAQGAVGGNKRGKRRVVGYFTAYSVKLGMMQKRKTLAETGHCWGRVAELGATAIAAGRAQGPGATRGQVWPRTMEGGSLRLLPPLEQGSRRQEESPRLRIEGEVTGIEEEARTLQSGRAYAQEGSAVWPLGS